MKYLSMKKTIAFIFIVFSLLQFSDVLAQDLLKSDDLSTVKVDYLSDSDISKIRAQLQANNITIEQASQMALQKRMPPSEVAKLKERLAMPATKSDPGKKDTTKEEEDLVLEKDSGRKQEKIVNTKVKDSINALIFGSQLFDNPTLNFEPNLKLATPVNYILGPGDELQVSIYGIQQFSSSIAVSLDGRVSLENVGQISVSGMTIEAATQKIRAAIARVYSTVSSGQSQLSVSLSRIRTIKVTIIGSRQPGNYSVSSLATAYNALFLGGGPGKNGSYRNIELLRNNKVYRTIDLYRFLVNGDQSDNVGLKDNDVIRIPAYSQRVTVEGQVKRPGLFEMKKGEVFNDLLSFASGFNEFAYTASVTVLQKTTKEFRVRDIKKAEYDNYMPQAGDVFGITKILDRFENRISIEGAVFRPDTYSFYEGMRISDLVVKADGLKEDAYGKRARIIRVKPNLTSEVINVDLEKAMNGNSESDLMLKKEDVLTIYSILDFVEEYKVTINGEIKNPGTYDFEEGLTLNDLLLQAGGLNRSASKRVEIARMIVSDQVDETNAFSVELFTIEIEPNRNEQVVDFKLEPFDLINIRKIAVYEKPKTVVVSGAVNYPGTYVLSRKKERLYDVIQRAGGLSSRANLEGVRIKRPIKTKQKEDLANVNSNLEIVLDTESATIPVNWMSILKGRNSSTNVTLFEGDEIQVSQFSEGVKVIGNVLLTSEIPYNKGKSFRYYLNAVGGVDDKGFKKKAYIIYPNGKAAVTKSFLVFRSYPKVTPGSQIVVPVKPEVTKMSTAEFVSIGSVIASLALLIVTALK
jgi:protein involved in polysaccharide export with SLBB domain